MFLVEGQLLIIQSPEHHIIFLLLQLNFFDSFGKTEFFGWFK
jgi:hypothetical protein